MIDTRNKHSPLDMVVSLFVLPLFMAASAQTAHALLAVIPVFIVFMLSSLFTVLLIPRVSPSLRSLVPVLFAFFFAWLSWALTSLIFPLYSLVFQFSFMLVPLAWLGAGRSVSIRSKDLLLAMGDAALEALSVSLFILFGAMLREFISIFSLSVPGESGARYLFSLKSVQVHSPGGFAGAVSALSLFVLLRLVYPVFSRRSRLVRLSQGRPAVGSPVASRVTPQKSPPQAPVEQPPLVKPAVYTPVFPEYSTPTHDKDLPAPSMGNSDFPLTVSTPSAQGERETPARPQNLPPDEHAPHADHEKNEDEALEDRESPDA